jgi:hypothetical protein
VETQGFILERGDDQGIFEEIAFLPAQGGAYTGHHYTYEDFRGQRDFAYYRLSELDKNGVKIQLDQLHINCANDEIKVFPNPFRDAFTVQLGDFAKGGNAKLLLFNNQGQLVYTAPIDPTKKTLNLEIPGLSKGIYTLSLRSDNLTENLRLIKD